MSVYQLKKDAEDAGILYRSAAIMRMRYLHEQMAMWALYLEETGMMPAIPYDDIVSELHEIAKSLNEETKPAHENQITDEMFKQAKAYPVDKLIEFKNGKAKCFAHEDKAPSMYFADRTNYANCPVCFKRWDSIEILVQRDGYTFSRAVKELCSR